MADQCSKGPVTKNDLVFKKHLNTSGMCSQKRMSLECPNLSGLKEVL